MLIVRSLVRTHQVRIWTWKPLTMTAPEMFTRLQTPELSSPRLKLS